ncbi:hypothetical protein CsSME_00032703 [Camellia sinensis var. sinensis]
MFHLGNKPPPSMGPSFPQGQPPLPSQPPPQSVYQVGGSHFGTEFNSQVGSSMQPERAPAWIPGLADNAMGSQLPGPPLMLSLSQGLFLSPPLLCETDDGVAQQRCSTFYLFLSKLKTLSLHFITWACHFSLLRLISKSIIFSLFSPNHF